MQSYTYERNHRKKKQKKKLTSSHFKLFYEQIQRVNKTRKCKKREKVRKKVLKTFKIKTKKKKTYKTHTHIHMFKDVSRESQRDSIAGHKKAV